MNNVFSQEEYYKNATIPPPDDDIFYEGESRITKIVVDSMYRDTTLFPNPNTYDMVFDDEIHDVISAQLININMPLPMYLINIYFNTLSIIYNNQNYNIVLDIGDYSPDELALEISNKCAYVNILCTYSSKRDNFIFSCNSPFSMNFNITNSLAQLLGFYNTQYFSDNNNHIKSRYRKNFEFNNYIIMFIKQFDLLKNESKVLNQAFAIIPKKNEDLNVSDEPLIIKYFNPPISKLLKIQVSLTDRFGNLYDFQNFDHRYELLFKSHKLRRKYGALLQNHYKQK